MIDPTGRSARFDNRKLVRLVGLIGGVFVIGCGIGWLVGQINAPPTGATTSQNAATTLPTSLPAATAQTAAVSGSQAPPPVTSAPAEPPIVPSPVAPVPITPTPPPAAAAAPPPVAAPGAAGAAPSRNAAPIVEFEPSEEPPPAAQAAPPAPAEIATPPAVARHEPRRSHHRADKHHRRPRDQGRAAPADVTVIGARGASQGARWIIQLGAFRTHDHAALLVLTLRAHGTAADVKTRIRGKSGTWYVVETPSQSSLKATIAVAHRIAARERVKPYVMRAQRGD